MYFLKYVIFETLVFHRAVFLRCGGTHNDHLYCSQFCAEFGSERVLKISWTYAKLPTIVWCVVFYSQCTKPCKER